MTGDVIKNIRNFYRVITTRVAIASRNGEDAPWSKCQGTRSAAISTRPDSHAQGSRIKIRFASK